MRQGSSAAEFIASLPLTREGLRPFKADVQKELAFGVIPAMRKYELFYERYRSAAEILTPLLARREERHEKLKILDIGCGWGFMKFFFEHFDADWHGIECWQRRADFCERIGYEIYQFDLNHDRFPWPDEHFDLVIASHVFEHLSNMPRALDESDRVPKPGGYFLIATPTKPLGIAPILQMWHALGSRKLGETQNAFSYRSLKRACLRQLKWGEDSVVDLRGFRIISARKCLPLENWKWFYRASTFLGKWLLPLVPEVNIIFRKPTGVESHRAAEELVGCAD